MIEIKSINLFPNRKNDNRSCGECTACCEGWLFADVKIKDVEYIVRPGNQCPMIVNHSCSIYHTDLRPLHPCRDYSCIWLDNKEIPDHMRPDKSGVILTEKSFKNISYIQMVETGRKVDSSILAQVINYAFLNRKNLEYIVDKQTYHLGSQEFMGLVTKELMNKLNPV